jgi:hypothetical protein
LSLSLSFFLPALLFLSTPCSKCWKFWNRLMKTNTFVLFTVLLLIYNLAWQKKLRYLFLGTVCKFSKLVFLSENPLVNKTSFLFVISFRSIKHDNTNQVCLSCPELFDTAVLSMKRIAKLNIVSFYNFL